MAAAPLPANEAERLAALNSYDILDSECEASFDNIAALAAKITGSPMALISLIDSERQWFKAHHGVDATETHRDLAFCAHAILNPTEMLVVPDATRDARFAHNPLVIGAPDIRFYAGMPLVNPQGFALGTLCVIDTEAREMTADHRDSLAKLAEMATTTLELRRAMNQSQRLALTDALTGIPNRAAFLDMLGRTVSRQKRHGDEFALLYLDLDGFKQVNDRYGHATGDLVLRDVATTLSASVRNEDMAARLGGDEFAAVLVGRDVHALVVAERIKSAIDETMRAAGWQVTASVGAVTFRVSPDDAAAALAAADRSMYEAKLAGKNRVLHRDYAPSAHVPAGAGSATVSNQYATTRTIAAANASRSSGFGR